MRHLTCVHSFVFHSFTPRLKLIKPIPPQPTGSLHTAAHATGLGLHFQLSLFFYFVKISVPDPKLSQYLSICKHLLSHLDMTVIAVHSSLSVTYSHADEDMPMLGDFDRSDP